MIRCRAPEAVDILGKWHGTKYRFVQRYRSGFPENLGEEFDAPFTRLDWISRDHFDIQWHRHTGAWFCRNYGDSALNSNPPTHLVPRNSQTRLHTSYGRLLIIIVQKHALFLEGAVGAVVALEEVFVVAGEEAVHPVLIEVFEIESDPALREVVEVVGR